MSRAVFKLACMVASVLPYLSTLAALVLVLAWVCA
jgi:hypothetical protein